MQQLPVSHNLNHHFAHNCSDVDKMHTVPEKYHIYAPPPPPKKKKKKKNSMSTTPEQYLTKHGIIMSQNVM